MPPNAFIGGVSSPGQPPLWVGIVGARSASGASLELASELARTVADAGGVVVSGGALGVDAAAHRGALAAGGRTVAVMASGWGALYPAVHRPLYEDIINTGGSLVTPYAPGVPPRRFHFVRRNRILAGLCDLVVVVEAGTSSGSLYTAKAARDYGRRLAAVPGSPGCEALLADAAYSLTAANEVVELARGDAQPPRAAAPSDELERRVLAALGSVPECARQLAEKMGEPARDIDRVLTSLEISRLALALPGREYVCSALGEAARS